MRPLLSTVGLAILLSSCQLFAPGQADFAAALEQMNGPEGDRTWHADSASADELAAIHHHLDAAIDAGHTGALHAKAVVVWQTDGLLAAEPVWRQLAETDDHAWGMVAYIASARPALEAGVRVRDLPPGRQLDWLDTAAEVAVLREGAASGSATADSLLRARFDVLRGQRAAGNADADSLLTLLDA